MTLKKLESLHPMVQLLVVPVLGALFLVFLPVIGFALLGQTIVQAVAARFTGLLNPIPTPGEAYLTGQATQVSEKLKDDLKELADEVEKLRKR